MNLGCSQLEYVEIIAPSYAGGLLGPGNSRLCGMNTDQHLYMDVKLVFLHSSFKIP